MSRFELLGDESLKKSEDEAGRAPRDVSDVQRQNSDGTVETRSERRKKFLSEWQQAALPNPPEIPGWHLCWLSTTNSFDPIHKRMRLGYEPVKLSDIPGFESYAIKSGENKGFIGINEMLLFKIPTEIYQELMEELHYYQPQEEEAALKRSTIDNISERDNNGRVLGEIEGEGIAGLGQRTKVPTFT